MQIRFTRTLIAAAVALPLVAGLAPGLVGDASAQVALEEGGDEEGTPPPPPDETAGLEAANKPRLGIGLRIRNVRIPEGMFEWFIEDVPGSVSNVGIGLEIARRRGNFEFQFGLEYEHLTAPAGLWVEKGKPVMGGNVDRVVDNDFRWITAEVSFMNHSPIIDQVSLRYGGGAGIAVLMGSVNRTDQFCATNNLDSCVDAPAPNDNTPYDTPPVFIVVNAVIGLQIRPTPDIFINLEGGLRTLPFFGATAGYYF